MCTEILIREILMSQKAFTANTIDKKVYLWKFDEIGELIDFVRDRGKNAWIIVKPNKIELLLVDPSKDLRDEGHPDLR